MKSITRKITGFIATICLLAAAFLPNTYAAIVKESVVVASASTDYYAGLDLNQNGTAFRSSLANLITSTQTYNTTYDELRNVFPYSDKDPDVSGNILWFYTGTSFRFTGSFTDGTNREHVWPKNAGNAFPEKSECGSDAHHLRPANANLNSSRSNNNFGEVAETNGNIVKENGKTAYANLCYQANQTFYPGEGYRGATARILMYVQTRWGDKYNLEFVLGKGNNKTIGDIEDLLKWHYQEPPTQEEIIRNEYVYSIQGNRNPFIDHPEYATKIYCYDGKSYNSVLQTVAATYDKYTEDQITATDITVNQSLEMTVGEQTSLSVTVTPANADYTLTYQSSNTSVATVSDSGVVTANEQGSATITVTDTVSGIQKTVSVTVIQSGTTATADQFKVYVLMAKARANTDMAFTAITNALNAYNSLNQQEKLSVYDDYLTLLDVITVYNNNVTTVNDEAKNNDEGGMGLKNPSETDG